jgi:hypothetical protein
MTVLLLVACAVAVAAVLILRQRRRRAGVYPALAGLRRTICATHPAPIATALPSQSQAAVFDRQRLVSVPAFLDAPGLQGLIHESEAARSLVERSYIPRHKQGGTLSYEAIHHHAPGCLAFYLSPALREWLSALIGTGVYPTADHDQSSCSILVYDRKGDHIGWHYDYNFYRGRHFTVLLALSNRRLATHLGAAPGLSDGELQRRCAGGIDTIATPPNTLVVFEGCRVSHRATAIGDDQERVILSMTFSTDPRVHPWKEAARRIKDMAYFGPRALLG